MRAQTIFTTAIFCVSTALAQVPDAAPAAPAAGGQAPIGQKPAPQAGAPKPQNSPFGQEVPVLDPGTEVVTFNGKNYAVSNNPIFQARFEKFLNCPEATNKEDADYRAILDRILACLAPGNATPQNIDVAFKLLPYGARYDIDAHLCDSLADAVYAVWQAQRSQAHLSSANTALEEELRRLEWNLQSVTEGRKLQAPPAPASGRANGGGAKQGGGAVNPANSTDYQTASYTRRHAERLVAIKANDVKKALSELQAKVEFQTMMAQFLLQRRFQHVIMSTRFYRALFTDGDSKLNLGKDATDLFAKSTGMPPTVSVIDSVANEAIRDVREGVKAFDFLLTKNEMDGATKQLRQAFLIGEYMPEVRLVQREKKRQCLEFAQKSFQLISAINVHDYGRAESLVKDLKKVANDFDDSQPTAAVEGARLKARALIGKARQAALSSDQVTLERVMNEAGEIWPGNPEFKEAMDKLFTQGDVVQKALLDFDQLLSQKNYRQIWADKVRFIAAVSVNPERKPALEKVMADMQTIEASLMRAEEMARQGVYAGAWETLEHSWALFPDDAKLNQQRADMTTRASDFVKVIRSAEELEKKEQFGSSLAHFLKAQKLYPASEFAHDGISRLVKQVLPES